LVVAAQMDLAGLVIQTGSRKYSIDNHGEFRIVDPCRNSVVALLRYTPAEVVDFCREYQAA